MKTIMMTALAAFAMGTAAFADTTPTTPAAPAAPAAPVTHDPGYDRPAPTNTQSDGHEHVVYWTVWYDHLDFDVQDAADAHNNGDWQTKDVKEYRKKHGKH